MKRGDKCKLSPEQMFYCQRMLGVHPKEEATFIEYTLSTTRHYKHFAKVRLVTSEEDVEERMVFCLEIPFPKK